MDFVLNRGLWLYSKGMKSCEVMKQENYFLRVVIILLIVIILLLAIKMTLV